ncbi:hypothetical protein M432DRAFT_26283 [Thermoascus aurantiacus ATCC 26904]
MGPRHHRGRETKFGPPQTAPNKQKRKGKSGHCASMLHGSPVVTDRGRRLTAAAPQVVRTTAASLFHRTISCVRVRRKSLHEEHLEKRNRSGAHWLRPSWLSSCPGHSRFAALLVLILLLVILLWLLSAPWPQPPYITIKLTYLLTTKSTEG